MRSLRALLATVALVMPAPQAQAKTLMVANCLGGAVSIRLPVDPAQQDRHDCCRKGCHAASDRRKKRGAWGSGCC
jgi:hypothetical protein